MTTIGQALAVLQKALDRCREEDVRTAEVYAALEFLGSRAAYQWPLDRFREALDNEANDGGWQSEGRAQLLNASLNGIRLALEGAKEQDNPTKAKTTRAFR